MKLKLWILTQLCLLCVTINLLATHANAAPTVNPIVTENQLPGTTDWQLTRKANDTVGQIKGYASATRVNKGAALNFYISVNQAQNYKIDIYRMGWYGGTGGRLLQQIGPLTGTQQRTPTVDRQTGLIVCDWAVSHTLRIPTSWTSGIYLAKLTNAQGYQNYIIFVVRDDSRRAALLYQQTVMTYQAYNNFPDDDRTGKSYYEERSFGANTLANGKRAVKVSFDRPYARDGSGKFFNWEYYFIRWIERSGYDVAYSTNLDTYRSGSRLLNYRAFISSGHDEYWSAEMFDAAERARDAGVNLAFFGGNTVYWQVRMEPSARNVADRIMVGYKNVAQLDPISNPRLVTDLWRDVGRPEQGLLGILFPLGAIGGNNPYVVQNDNHWLYQGVGVRNNDKIPGIVGYEIDAYDSTLPLPTNREYTMLAASPFTGKKGQKFTANSIIYRAPSQAWVFAAGTTSWSWGLDKAGYVDPRLQKLTTNILNAFSNTVNAATPAAADEQAAGQQVERIAAETYFATSCATGIPDLAQNGDFAEATKNWRFTGQADAALAITADGGCGQAAQITAPAGQQNLLLYQDGIKVEPARHYRLSFLAKAIDQGAISLYLVQPDQRYTNLGVANASFDLTPAWQKYVIEFTTTNFDTPLADARLLFWFAPYGQSAGTYWVDEILLTPIDYRADQIDPKRHFCRVTPGEAVPIATVQGQIQRQSAMGNLVPATDVIVTLLDLESNGLLFQSVAAVMADGRYLIDEVAAGEYLLLVESADGHRQTPVLLAVTSTQTVNVDLVINDVTYMLYLPAVVNQ